MIRSMTPRRRILPAVGLLGVAMAGAGAVLATLRAPHAEAQEAPYRSPYRVEFTLPPGELIGDLIHSERGDPRREAEVEHEHWYAPRTRERWGAWGPPARHYPAPVGLERWPVERRRERAVAVATRFLGYAYQHHHIPDWSPPAGWPWKSTCAGRNGKGVDCSNLSGFVYNQGFGVVLNTDVQRQSEQLVVPGPGPGRSTRLERIELPSSYEERLNVLRTGDLLYIRNRAGHISHVVLWVGPIGHSPDGTPLVLDSHGEDVTDSEGRPIPCGVQLRPFRRNSWYHHSASHAHRVFPDAR
jgi:hypothetical protein